MKKSFAKPGVGRIGVIVAMVVALVATFFALPAKGEPGQIESAHPDFTVEDLGPALSVTNVRSAEFGVDPDGTEVIYAISNGTPATFSMLDAATGEQYFGETLGEYELGGWVLQADDGRVFFTARNGSKAAIFEFHPDTEELVELDLDLQGQRVLYTGSLADDGTIYVGTYPDAMVLGYNINTGEMTDLGQMTDDADYTFSVGLVNDELWAGTGPVPYLYRIDLATGDRVEVDPPAFVMENTDWFIGLEQRGDYVFVRLSPRGTYDMAVYDVANEQWLDGVIIEGSFGTPVSDLIDGKVYYLADHELRGFDTESQEDFSTGFADSDIYAELSESVGTYRFDVNQTDAGLLARGINTDGKLWTYNLDSGESSIQDADVMVAPIGAHSMGVGPDGAIYMGAYLSSGAISRIDPETGELQHLGGPKQGDTIITHGDNLVVSSYPGANIHTVDVSEGLDWTQAEHVLELGRGEPHFQDRIFGLASTGDRIAIGSVADYGQLGGALTLLDPETGDFSFYRDIIEDQSIVSLGYNEGIVYGGTSIHGGMSTTPTASAGEFFLWDVEAEEVISTVVVDENAAVINEVAVAPGGTPWGLTSSGILFTADPQTGEIVDRIDVGLPHGNNWGISSSLFHLDGWVYASAGGSFVRVNAETHEMELIAEGGVRYSAADANGNIYFTDDVHVYALHPAGSDEDPGDDPTDPEDDDDQGENGDDQGDDQDGQKPRPGLPNTGVSLS